MDKKALQLLCRFSLPPNSLGYCGKNSAIEKFRRCIVEGRCSGVQRELKKFIVLHPYLRLISKISGLPRFSNKVAEAYWLGNNTLKNTKPRHYNLLLKYFSEQGVPENLIEDLRHRVPKEFIPTHLFQVLYVGVGKASGSVPYNINTINNCMVRWGKVVNISDNQVIANLTSIKKIGGKLSLVKIRQKFPVPAEKHVKLNRGSIVAVHWGQIVKKLSHLEEKNLNYWTRRVLRILADN
ncbi:MAG: hypothetical protein KatS3mg101_0662 [Patescibacteria group bacterium]|nr:MAG: hypothetical protein KatS3mg101_0662 [Patescibacteria group bacterium]